jgi:hypothetical protein
MNGRLDAEAGFQRIIEIADSDARHGQALSAMIARYALLTDIEASPVARGFANAPDHRQPNDTPALRALYGHFRTRISNPNDTFRKILL